MLSLEDSELSLKHSLNQADCDMVPAHEEDDCSQEGNAERVEVREVLRGRKSKLTKNSNDLEMICEFTGHRQVKDLTESENGEGTNSERNRFVNEPSNFESVEHGATLADQTEQSLRERNEKYYKKFDFFYRRTAFRSMTEFYKGLFKPNLDKWREGERKSTKNFVLNYLWKKSELEYRGSKDQKDIKKLQILVN